jgi:HTH-type transcriptional regulator, transcriptional repressor of NAD biosynthesis genes
MAIGNGGARRSQMNPGVDTTDVLHPPRFALGLVVGKFAPLHQGHHLVIETALAQCSEAVVLVYSNPDWPWMPSAQRAKWISTLFPGVRVMTPGAVPPDSADDWVQREFVRQWLAQAGLTIDAVFGSDDYLAGFASHIGATAVKVDAQRLQQPISGTALRQAVETMRRGSHFGATGLVYNHPNAVAAQQKLKFCAPIVRQHLEFWAAPIQSVVFLGAESTGKSTLAAKMAQEYQTELVAEWGRTVWERQNGQLQLSDYVDIAQKHRELEDIARQKSHQYLFVDTNAITTMFLGYAYAGRGLPVLTELAREAESRYHHAFLCSDDIPFEQDGWRDDGLWRTRAQSMVRYDLAVRGIAYTELYGDLEARAAQVRRVLDSGMSSGPLESN